MERDRIKTAVRKGYAKIAKHSVPCCNLEQRCGCGNDGTRKASSMAGYSSNELNSIPSGADMGLGCGNPVALASLRPGETVLDLGSGGGVDCFLAARAVGLKGRVIGVDMTPEMVDRARENARKGGYDNVEFRLGEIEHLPAADASVDVVISNCVVNLSPDKGQTFAETYRVLRPGGRLMVSDMVLIKELPKAVRSSIESYVSCVAGAAMKDQYLEAIRAAGFTGVTVEGERNFSEGDVPMEVKKSSRRKGISGDTARQVLASVASIQVSAKKPG